MRHALIAGALALAACHDTLPPAPTPTGISLAPNQGSTERPTAVEIRGDFIVAVVGIDLDNPSASTISSRMTARLGDFALEDIRPSNAGGVAALVPTPSMKPGDYDLSVIDAAGRSASLAGAFHVFTPPPPSICGDGKIEGDEACDDGNTISGDGCSSTCVIEPGFTCSGTPSMCTRMNPTPGMVCFGDLCSPEDDVVFVRDRTTGCPGSGSMADPYCRIQRGVDDGRHFIVVGAGHYPEGVIIDHKKRTLVAPQSGAVVAAPAGMSFTVQNGAEVLISGLQIQGVNTIQVLSPSTRLSLVASTLGPSSGIGLVAANGAHVAIDRTVIRMNGQAGLVLFTPNYEVTNTIIAENGSSSTNDGAVQLLATSTVSRFANNTIADNLVAAGHDVASQIECAAGAKIVNSIVWQTTHSGGQIAGDLCVFAFSDVKGSQSGDGNLAADPMFVAGSFVIAETSPCVDAGDPRGVLPAGPAPAHDFNGTQRPKGPRVDIGAFEVR